MDTSERKPFLDRQPGNAPTDPGPLPAAETIHAIERYRAAAARETESYRQYDERSDDLGERSDQLGHDAVLAELNWLNEFSGTATSRHCDAIRELVKLIRVWGQRPGAPSAVKGVIHNGVLYVDASPPDADGLDPEKEKRDGHLINWHVVALKLSSEVVDLDCLPPRKPGTPPGRPWTVDSP